MTASRRLVLATRPSGMVDDTVVRLESVDVPEPADGEAVVRVRWLSIDPTIRTWMDDAPGYLPPIEVDAVIRSGGLGEVVASRNDAYPVGATVFGMLGWQDHAVVDGAGGMAQVVPDGMDPTAVLSVFGTTGMTAYFGLLDIGRPKEGDTVVVSGAAGATGSVVGQIAKLKGCRVIGIAGGPEKCAWLVDELGFDGAVDYKAGHVAADLRALCPKGIDVYFDNVGGEILDTCLAQLAMKARVVCCGAISAYNEDRGSTYGLTNYFTLITKRARMEGFLILDYLDRFAEAQGEVLGWVLEGKVKHAVHVVDGLEHATDALNLLFTGGNTGKVIVKLDG